MKGRTILVLASRADTSHDLRRFLESAGARAEAHDETSVLESAGKDVDAIVVFPDDFTREDGVTLLERLRAIHPSAFLVVVTQHVAVFGGALSSAPRSVLLRRPAWGWMILEALTRGFREGAQ